MTKSRTSYIIFPLTSFVSTTRSRKRGNSAQNRTGGNMPLGRYPDRVKPFRKWANEMVDKSNISNSATAKRFSRLTRRRPGRRKRKANGD